MKRLIILFLMSILIFPLPAPAKETRIASVTTDTESQPNIIRLSVSSKSKMPSDKQFLKNSWQAIKGMPSENSLNLLMFSLHTRKDRDQMNESNKLVGLDYNGYCVGTYNNSYHVQTYYAGITRKVFQTRLPEGVNMDFKYKLMALHGYERYEFNIGGITPLIVPMVGFTKGPVGIDFLLSPGKTITFATNFRINLNKN